MIRILIVAALLAACSGSDDKRDELARWAGYLCHDHRIQLGVAKLRYQPGSMSPPIQYPETIWIANITNFCAPARRTDAAIAVSRLSGGDSSQLDVLIEILNSAERYWPKEFP